MKSILWLNEVEDEDAREVGYNAMILGKLAKNEIKISKGFVISASSFWNFLEEANIKIKILEILNNINIVKCRFKKISN